MHDLNCLVSTKSANVLDHRQIRTDLDVARPSAGHDRMDLDKFDHHP